MRSQKGEEEILDSGFGMEVENGRVGLQNAGMTYKRFEDVPVWQDAAGLAREVFDLVEDDAFRMRESRILNL